MVTFLTAQFEVLFLFLIIFSKFKAFRVPYCLHSTVRNQRQCTYWWSRSTNWANSTCWSTFTLRSLRPTLAFSTRLTSCTLWAEKHIEQGVGKACTENTAMVWHPQEDSTNNTHRRSSKSTRTYGTRLTAFTLKRGQGREDQLEWALKRHFSQYHVSDTGTVVGIATYRDTTCTSRTSRTSRTCFTLKQISKML